MTDFRKTLSLLAVLAACASAGPVRADILELRPDKRLYGIILDETPESVRIQTAGGNMTVPKTLVLRVEREPEAMNLLRRAEFDLCANRLAQAREKILQAAEKGITNAQIHLWCVENQAPLEKTLKNKDIDPLARRSWVRLTRQLAGLPDLSDGGAVLLAADRPGTLTLRLTEPFIDPRSRRFLLTNGINATTGEKRDFLLVMAGIYADLGQEEFSAELLGQMDIPTLKFVGNSSPYIQTVLVQSVLLCLQRNDFQHAATVAARMEAAGLPAAQACQTLLLLRWSSFARELGEYDRALNALGKYLLPLSESLARMRMVDTLIDAQQRLPAAGEYEKAIGLLQKWGSKLPDSNPVEATAQVYLRWGRDLLEANKPAQARQAFNEYYRLKPKEKKTYLNQCEFKEKFIALDEKDFAGAFRLGQWAANEGLWSLAIYSFEKARENEDLQKPAEEQIRLMENNISGAHYNNCLEWIDMGEPAKALEELGRFPFFPSTRHLRPEINKLRTLCKSELVRREQFEAIQAEVLLQDVERRFLLGERETALQDLRNIVREYPETPSAPRARNFLRVASARHLLEKLEGGAPTLGETTHSPRTTVDVENEIRYLLKHLGKGSIQPHKAPNRQP